MVNLIKRFYSKLPWVVKRNQVLREIKQTIKCYFEGFDFAPVHEPRIPIMELGIFDIKLLKLRDDLAVVEITLDRSGLLIGKGGATFNSLTNFVSRMIGRKVEIRIKENKFWW